MTGTVYEKGGQVFATCAHPSILVNKPPPHSQTLSWGAGYPPVALPPCPDCNAALAKAPGSSDPTQGQITVQAAIDAGVLPPPPPTA